MSWIPHPPIPGEPLPKIEVFATYIMSTLKIRGNHDRVFRNLALAQIPYVTYDVASDDAARQRWKRLNNGNNELPFILSGGEPVGTIAEMDDAVEHYELEMFLRLSDPAPQSDADLLASLSPEDLAALDAELNGTNTDAAPRDDAKPDSSDEKPSGVNDPENAQNAKASSESTPAAVVSSESTVGVSAGLAADPAGPGSSETEIRESVSQKSLSESADKTSSSTTDSAQPDEASIEHGGVQDADTASSGKELPSATSPLKPRPQSMALPTKEHANIAARPASVALTSLQLSKDHSEVSDNGSDGSDAESTGTVTATVNEIAGASGSRGIKTRPQSMFTPSSALSSDLKRRHASVSDLASIAGSPPSEQQDAAPQDSTEPDPPEGTSLAETSETPDTVTLKEADNTEAPVSAPEPQASEQVAQQASEDHTGQPATKAREPTAYESVHLQDVSPSQQSASPKDGIVTAYEAFEGEDAAGEKETMPKTESPSNEKESADLHSSEASPAEDSHGLSQATDSSTTDGAGPEVSGTTGTAPESLGTEASAAEISAAGASATVHAAPGTAALEASEPVHADTEATASAAPGAEGAVSGTTAPEAPRTEGTASETTASEAPGTEGAVSETKAPEVLESEGPTPEKAATDADAATGAAPESTSPETTGTQGTAPDSTTPESAGIQVPASEVVHNAPAKPGPVEAPNEDGESITDDSHASAESTGTADHEKAATVAAIAAAGGTAVATTSILDDQSSDASDEQSTSEKEVLDDDEKPEPTDDEELIASRDVHHPWLGLHETDMNSTPRASEAPTDYFSGVMDSTPDGEKDRPSTAKARTQTDSEKNGNDSKPESERSRSSTASSVSSPMIENAVHFASSGSDVPRFADADDLARAAKGNSSRASYADLPALQKSETGRILIGFEEPLEGMNSGEMTPESTTGNHTFGTLADTVETDEGVLQQAISRASRERDDLDEKEFTPDENVSHENNLTEQVENDPPLNNSLAIFNEPSSQVDSTPHRESDLATDDSKPATEPVPSVNEREVPAEAPANTSEQHSSGSTADAPAGESAEPPVKGLSDTGRQPIEEVVTEPTEEVLGEPVEAFQTESIEETPAEPASDSSATSVSEAPDSEENITERQEKTSAKPFESAKPVSEEGPQGTPAEASPCVSSKSQHQSPTEAQDSPAQTQDESSRSAGNPSLTDAYTDSLFGVSDAWASVPKPKNSDFEYSSWSRVTGRPSLTDKKKMEDAGAREDGKKRSSGPVHGPEDVSELRRQAEEAKQRREERRKQRLEQLRTNRVSMRSGAGSDSDATPVLEKSGSTLPDVAPAQSQNNQEGLGDPLGFELDGTSVWGTSSPGKDTRSSGARGQVTQSDQPSRDDQEATLRYSAAFTKGDREAGAAVLHKENLERSLGIPTGSFLPSFIRDPTSFFSEEALRRAAAGSTASEKSTDGPKGDTKDDPWDAESPGWGKD